MKIDNLISEEESVTFGIPQGSINGPTLFLIYINDLCNIQLKNGSIVTFADDTALFFSGESWEDVFNTAQQEMKKVSSWLQNNILTLNVSKTKYVAFAHRNHLLPPSSLNITVHSCSSASSRCSCPSLERTDQIKYLGVIIDQTLTFKPHVQVLNARMRKLIHIFRTLKQVADKKTVKMVYYALFQSSMDYCISSWGGAAKTHLIQLERTQRCILKVSAGLPYRFPTEILYRNWEVLTVRQSFILQTILKMHSLVQYDPNLNRDKRRKGTVCQVKPFHTSHTQKFFCFLGAYLYNRVNSVIPVYHCSISSCKTIVTNWLKTLDYTKTESLLCQNI